MTGTGQRWLLSFVDLLLLLLGFFVLLHAQQGDKAALSAGMRTAFGARAANQVREEQAAALFEAGEAVVTPAGRSRLQAIAQVSKGRRIRLESLGVDAATGRFDGWELGAARLAAAARALTAAGTPENRIDITQPRLGSGGGGVPAIRFTLAPQ